MRETDRAIHAGQAARPLTRHLAWLPIPLIALTATVLYAVGPPAVYESTTLLAALSGVLRTSTSLLIAYLAARTYLVAGSRPVLALGCGALISGVVSLLAGQLMADLNVMVTIHNGGLLLAGACFLLSAAWALRPIPRASTAPRAKAATLSYLGVLAAIGLLLWGALAGVLPKFRTAQGFTALRQGVLGLTALEFELAALCSAFLYRRSPTSFFRWYGAGLALVGIGMAVIIAEGAPGTALSWVGRAAQFLGCLYMLVGVVAVAEGRWGWGIPLEQALYQSEERYQALIETSPDAIVVHRNGHFLYANTAALQLFHADTFQRLQAHNGFDLFPPELRAQGRWQARQIAPGVALSSWEGSLLRLDGQPVFVEARASPVTFQGDPATQAVLRDITGRKQAEAERERLLEAEHRARAQAEAALRARDEFLGAAAHELKTPITGLRGRAQLSLKGLEKRGVAQPEEVRQAMEVIDREAARLAIVVSRLIDLVEIDAGELRLDRERADLVPLARRLVRTMQAGRSKHCITLHAPDTLVADVDASRLQQILYSLVDNAIRFSPQGGPVDVDLSAPDAYTLRCAVRDRGIGVPPEQRPRLFQRYFQGAVRPAGGLGLALYAARHVVELHGGHIWAEFPPDGGSTFVFTLPVNA